MNLYDFSALPDSELTRMMDFVRANPDKVVTQSKAFSSDECRALLLLNIAMELARRAWLDPLVQSLAAEGRIDPSAAQLH